MAASARPLTVAGVGAALSVAALILGAIGVVAWHAQGPGGLGPADWQAVRFTLWQAAASAVLSVGLAVPVARTLSRRRFIGRDLLITLLGAPFILPVIVAILALLTVFGRSGWLNDGIVALGGSPVSLYGPGGVILAHVFFNLPLCVRLILQGWQAVPAERFRLAASLDLSPGQVFRLIEWPMLRAVGPGAFLIVFLVCTTSFAVALTLGGGPAATTIELAIYQAFIFDYDLARAALLALVQMAVTLTAALLALRLSLPDVSGRGLDRPEMRWDLGPPGVDRVWIGAAALFIGGPMAAIVWRGLPGLAVLSDDAAWAAARSLAVAISATLLTLALALCVATAASRLRNWRRRFVESAAMLGIAASPLVLGTGAFLALAPWLAPVDMTLPVTTIVNALIALPFALRVLSPALSLAETTFGSLADSLDLQGAARWRWLILPRLRRPLGFAAGLTAALSIGDLGVVALFADPRTETLPLHMYRLMGAYRMEEAAGVALVLVALSLGVFWLCDTAGRWRAAV